MEYSDFQASLKEAGFSITEFARLMGKQRNSITNYSHLGYVPAHLAVIATLMRELKRRDVAIVPLLEKLQLETMTTRRPRKPARYSR